MTDVQADYLRITAPQIKESYIDILRRIAQFSHLSEELLLQLFEYSKFMRLEDKERAFQEGTFGQNIYILIQGRLEVYVQTEAGGEKQTDVIFKPFSIFGEQCILGEAYDAAVEARGEVLLLAIDMSALPDLIEGRENPERRLQDDAYRQSLDMNTIFATVLLNRLHRLIKDQYKLVQKLLILHQSVEYQQSWVQNVLLTTIFNEFSQNQLSQKLEAHTILKQTLKPSVPDNAALAKLLSNPPVNTEKVYMELVRLETLGRIENVNILVLESVQRLAAKAMTLEEYTKGLEPQPHRLPAIISLPDFLEEVFLAITASGVLEKKLSKEQFLEGFLSEVHPEPLQLATFLGEGGWTTSSFNLAYLMLLICRACIQKEFELNRLIADCVAYLTTLNTPRQNVQLQQQSLVEDSHSLTKELIDLYQSTIVNDADRVKERPPDPSSPQDSVEDLLSEFGM